MALFTTEQACLKASFRRVPQPRRDTRRTSSWECTEATITKQSNSKCPCRARTSTRSSCRAPVSMRSTPSLQPFSHVPRYQFKVCAVEPSLASHAGEPMELEREEGMPIPGTITFRRSSTQRHYEYVTDLETLGMENFSSGLSRSVALSMGISIAATSEASSTPASVSIDVTKEGRDLRLDGIVRTALALNCARCGVPVGERVFGEFSLLLTEKPVVEPTQQRIGVVLGEGGVMPDEEKDIEEMLDLDLDDKLHFPKTEKSIDISKYIRDTVHLEIPLQSLCVTSCRGRCIDCGINLNEGTCNCALKATKVDRSSMWGPLGQLKKQLESEGRG